MIELVAGTGRLIRLSKLSSLSGQQSIVIRHGKYAEMKTTEIFDFIELIRAQMSVTRLGGETDLGFHFPF